MPLKKSILAQCPNYIVLLLYQEHFLCINMKQEVVSDEGTFLNISPSQELSGHQNNSQQVSYSMRFIHQRFSGSSNDTRDSSVPG